MARVGFVLLAPHARIEAGVFSAMDKSVICEAVTRKAEAFDADAVEWRKTSFDALMPSCMVTAVSWESVLADIQKVDPQSGAALADFYAKCLQYNPLRAA